MFASKKLGFTLVLSSLLAACASTPKPSSDTSVVTVETETSEVDLEQLAKERASQGWLQKNPRLKKKTALSLTTLKNLN